MKKRAYRYCLRCGYYDGCFCHRYPPKRVYIGHNFDGKRHLESVYPTVGRRSFDGCGEWVDNRNQKGDKNENTQK